MGHEKCFVFGKYQHAVAHDTQVGVHRAAMVLDDGNSSQIASGGDYVGLAAKHKLVINSVNQKCTLPQRLISSQNTMKFYSIHRRFSIELKPIMWLRFLLL
jgi:hypothetical protein